MATIEMISGFLTGLGSTVLLSIVIAVLGLILGQKLGKAVISGLLVGVGFVGLGLVIGLLIGALAPAPDAIEVCTDAMTFDEVVDRLESLVKSRLGPAGDNR